VSLHGSLPGRDRTALHEVEGRPVAEVLERAEWTLLEPSVRAALAGEARTVLTISADHQHRYQTEVGPEVGADGTTVGVIAVSVETIDRPPEESAGQMALIAGPTRSTAENAAELQSAETLATIVESSDDAIIGKTLEGEVTSWNRGAERIYGYSAQEALGRHIAFLCPADREDEIHAILEPLRQGRGVDHFETVRRRRDGSLIDVSLSISPIRDAAGTTIGASTIARDISGRNRAARALARAEGRFETAVEAMLDAVAVISPVRDDSGEIVDFRYEYANDAYAGLVECTRPELRGQRLGALFPSFRGSDRFGDARRVAITGEPCRTEDGAPWKVAPGAAAASRVMDVHLTAMGEQVVVAARDVTSRRQLDNANRRLAALVHSTHDAVLATDTAGLILEWNRGAETLYGYCASEAIGQPVTILMDAALAADEAEIMRHVTAGGGIEQFETTRICKDGRRVSVSLTASPVRDDDGTVVGVARITRDISDRTQYEQTLRFLGDHDPLTGLWNRRRFGEELELELARTRRDQTPVTLLAVDLDHFKFVNDSLGHQAGDRIIVQTARLLQGRLRATDVLGRLGGDGFGILLAGTESQEALTIATELLTSIRNEVGTDGPGPHAAASIGIATVSGDAQLSADDLLAQADIAVYDAKDAGRDRAVLYDPARARHHRLGAHLTWADRIRHALEHDGFVLYAQPIVALQADSPPRHELLIRMCDTDGPLIPPGKFLEVAERTDLINQIDRWVLRRAIQALGREQRSGADIRLQVNLSAHSLADGDLPEVIGAELAAAGADGRGLCLEITETAAIVNLERAQQFAARLAALGCELALDDFGAGYASFYYLKHLSFDYLKIDGEFIKNMVHSTTDQLLVQSLANIARELGKQTVAEYVGDHRTVELLRNLGVDYGQGFYVARPTPLEETDLQQNLSHLRSSGSRRRQARSVARPRIRSSRG